MTWEKRAHGGELQSKGPGSSSEGKVKQLQKYFDTNICVLAESQATSAMQAVSAWFVPQHFNMQHFRESGSKYHF